MVTAPPADTNSEIEPHESVSNCTEIQVLQKYIQGPQIPDIDIIRSLQHTDRDVFYLTYWEDHCLPALHPIFYSVTRLLELPVLKDAILALSSCNISRIDAERKLSRSLDTMGTFSPSLTHQMKSHLYYSSAIRKFSLLSQGDYQNNTTVVLIIPLLFGYIEASMGNFEGFYCHVRGVSSFLAELRDTTGISLFRGLLTASLQTQFLVWWARAYFSSLDVQQHLPSIAFPRDLELFPGSLHERRAVVLSILCESHRLNIKGTLKHWNQHTESSLVSFASEPQTNREEFDDLLVRLENESKRLDHWFSLLPLSEHPLTGNTSETSPILFRSHDAALNFAYYIVARIMQCTNFLHNISSHDPQHLGSECLEMEPWVRLLLRIAQGTNMHTSVIRNNYTIGFSGLLLAASLRCQNLPLSVEIEQWLQTLESMKPTEEGAFPVYQALAVVKAINQQRRIGCDVFGVSQPTDDGGGTPKLTGYHSQMIITLLVHGKLRDIGTLFTERIDFGI